MARPDGRIEKGQRLNRAISARAWNRAQDAADVVLGVRPGAVGETAMTLPYSLSCPVRLTSTPTVDYSYIGVPIKITACEILGTETSPAGISYLSGQIAEATDLTGALLLPAPEMFALTLEPMKTGSNATNVVQCAIKGLAIARVRIFAATDRYVALPTRRSSAESLASLRGTLESSAAGYGRLICQINTDFSLVSI